MNARTGMKDMRQFLEQVEAFCPGDLVRIKRPVETRYEICALVKKLELAGRFPVLLFEKVKGYPQPVVCNLYGTRERLALALGTEAGKLAEEFRQREDNPIAPRLVSSGPVQEVVVTGEAVDITKLPVLTHHEADVAPYITSGIFLAKDPDTGIYNVSFGRLMVVDKNTVYTHVTPGRHLDHYYGKTEARGEALPVAICVGTHPALALGAMSLVPLDRDEVEVIGGMLGEPLVMVKCQTVPLEVPAYAELVLEGEILPKVRGREGPFCEFTGYATGVRDRHVVKIKALTLRQDMIYQALMPGGMEHRLVGAVSKESFLFKAAQMAVPTVKGLHIPASGTGRYHVYVSIEKKAKGQPRNVAMAIMGADIYAKHVFVVDEDIDVFDERQVLWALATRLQGHRDIIIIPGTRGSDLDPSCEEDGVVTKTIFDATAKPFLDEFAVRARIPEKVWSQTRIEDYL